MTTLTPNRLFSRANGQWLIAQAGFLLLFHTSISAQQQPTSAPTAPTQLAGNAQKIVAVVYPFRTPTDRATPTRNPLATAAPARYTTLLFNTLRNSGWFTPVEQADAGTLLNNQRDRATPQATSEASPTSEKPTLMLEAGLFAHDVATLADEPGLRFFDQSGTNQYQHDRATVFIRAISTQSGKILKTVYWTSNLLTQPLAQRTYRYVLPNALYGNSTGSTETPPDQFAVAEALRMAVRGLILEGIRDGLWTSDEASPKQLATLMATYEVEKASMNTPIQPPAPPEQVRSNRFQFTPRYFTMQLYGGLMRYHGDYSDWATNAAYGLSVEAYTTPYLGIQLNVATGTLSSQNAFSTRLTSAEASLIIKPFPYFRLTPLLLGGVGLTSRAGANPLALEGKTYLQFQAGAGLQYSLNPAIGFRAMIAYNMPRTDQLDGRRLGDHNDFYVRSTLGLVIHFGPAADKTR